MLTFLLILLLGLSLAVVFQRTLLNAVILLGVFSLASSVVYFLVGAPDVAVTEGAIGVAFVTFIYVLALSDQGKLHVMAEEVPPFIHQEKGRLQGLEYDILNGFAAEQNLDLEVEFVGHDELTSPIGNRRADLIAGARFRELSGPETVTNSESYHRGQLVQIRTSGESEKTGVLKGLELSTLAQVDLQNPSVFTSLDQMIEAYHTGAVSSLITDSARMTIVLNRLDSSLKNQSELTNLAQIEYCFSVIRKEEELFESLNEYLQGLKKTQDIQRLLDEHLR